MPAVREVSRLHLIRVRLNNSPGVAVDPDGGNRHHQIAERKSSYPSAAEVFDVAQHAAVLFDKTSIRDPEALVDVLLVITTQPFEAPRAQEALADAEVPRPRWKWSAEAYAPKFVRALTLAAACRPSSEAGVE
jgi:hypothetical protein